MLQRRAVPLFMLAFGLLVAGCSSGAAAGQEKYDRLAVVEDGVVRDLENGGRVTLADGVAAEVFMTPYPPERRTDLYLYLIQSGEGPEMDKPEVAAEYSMMYMNHGKYTRSGLELQHGRYLLPLNFSMSGAWAIDLRIGWTDKTARLRLVTKVLP